MSARMMRWQVPVDDQDHGVPAHGPVVACGTCAGLWSKGPAHWVEFWTVDRAEHAASDPTEDRVFRVFGTGHPIPDGYVWRGTADRYQGECWHLFERCAAEPPVAVRLSVADVDEGELVEVVRRAIRRAVRAGGGNVQQVLGGGW